MKSQNVYPPWRRCDFGVALQRILKQVLTAYPRLRPVYLIKVDLADAYMRLWGRMDDVPSFAFPIPKKNQGHISG